MRIAWVFPQRERCGIALYSRYYLEHIESEMAVERLDPAGFLTDRASFVARTNACDVVHIQYEPSFFFDGRSDFFPDLCKAIIRPLVVSLHEVYHTFPGVFPRDAITGAGIIGSVKRWRYDRRHPVQTAWRRHAAAGFHASETLVHYGFQREILLEQGHPPQTIKVIPHPINGIPGIGDDEISEDEVPDPYKRPLELAGIGFINPSYDYDLLLSTLALLDFPWRFTWIGGVRREEDHRLLDQLGEEIGRAGWQEQFTITGWVDEEERSRLLRKTELVCAFFSSRSSSGSLATAIGAGRLIIATPLPLTEELAGEGVLHLVPPTAEGIVEGIKQLLSDDRARMALLSRVVAYRDATSYAIMAKRVTDTYFSIVKPQGALGTETPAISNGD